MHCPRLDHFVRLNPNSTVSRCGHMINPPQFNSLEEMDASDWLKNIKQTFNTNVWPSECTRCQQTETIGNTSIRLNAIKFDQLQHRTDYLTVGGVLDNICNSACQMCSENLSTLIGGLQSKTYPLVNNTQKFWELPQERIVHLDINGGEPSASKNYRYVLQNLPSNVRSIRINTNCGLIIDEINDIINRGIQVTVTVSLDGINKVHDYVRWPIKWDKFYSNLMQYKTMSVQLNLWTTVNALNIGDFDNIVNFAKEHKIDHSWALLNTPDELNVKYTNKLTLAAKDKLPKQVAVDRNNNNEIEAYISKQDLMRNIKFKDYYDQL
jgi:sulfatase maturation enzyme AslB (radical SAM superfamily)